MMLIAQKEQKNQLPKDILQAFKELKVLQHLRNSGFKKRLVLVVPIMEVTVLREKIS